MTHFLLLYIQGENIDILCCSSSSASQGHRYGWVSIASPVVTLYFLFLPRRKRMFLDLFLFLLIFFWFPGFLLSAAPISLWFSPSFTFTLSYYSIFYDVGIKFLERQTEKLRVYQASESVLTRILSLILTIFLSSFFLRRTSKSCGLGRGPVTRWTSEDL